MTFRSCVFFISLLLIVCQGAYDYTFYSSTVSTPYSEYSNDAVVASTGFTYVVGTTDGPSFGPSNETGSFPSDAFVVVYPPLYVNSTISNKRQISSPFVDAAYGVTLSSSQSILYIAGTYASYPWVGFFDLNLNPIWYYLQYSTPPLNGNIGRFSDVAAVPGGVVAVGYAFSGSSSRWDAYVVRISDNTTVIWSRNITNISVDDYLNAVAFLSSSSRIFVGGETSRSGAGREFLIAEISYNTGATVTQAVWPGTSCSNAFTDRDQKITDIAVDDSGVYFLGDSTQEFNSFGTTNGVCGITTALVVGKLSFTLNQTLWIYNISQISSDYTVISGKFSLSPERVLYITGSSDAESLFGQPNSTPGGYIFDWFYYIVNGSTGGYLAFSYQGTPDETVDDIATAITVNGTSGAFGLTVNSVFLATKTDFTFYYGVPQSAVPSTTPTPTVTPSSSSIPSATPSVTPTSTPTSAPTSSQTPSSTTSPSSSSTPSTSSIPSASASPSPNPPTPSSGVYILIVIVALLVGIIIGLILGVSLVTKMRSKPQDQYIPLQSYGPAPGLVPVAMYPPQQ